MIFQENYITAFAIENLNSSLRTVCLFVRVPFAAIFLKTIPAILRQDKPPMTMRYFVRNVILRTRPTSNHRGDFEVFAVTHKYK